MRALVVPKLRQLWPDARIIHELPLRYSTRRIDLAAVTPDALVSVEIKSSRDDTSRLEAQMRGFAPVSDFMICAVAPKHLTGDVTNIIERTVGHACGLWVVDVPCGSVTVDRGHWLLRGRWAHHMLDMLHVEELIAIADQHRVSRKRRPNHTDLVDALTDILAGREVKAAFFAALRSRHAFAAQSDPPIREQKLTCQPISSEPPLL